MPRECVIFHKNKMALGIPNSKFQIRSPRVAEADWHWLFPIFIGKVDLFVMRGNGLMCGNNTWYFGYEVRILIVLMFVMSLDRSLL